MSHLSINNPQAADSNRSSSSSIIDNKSDNNSRPGVRIERQLYSDNWILEDDGIEGKITINNFSEKLESRRFTKNFTIEMTGEDFNVAYIQKTDIPYPVLCRDKSGLGIRVPSPSFTLQDVCTAYGARYIICANDVLNETIIEMTTKEFLKYYENPRKDKLLHVISLEISHSPLKRLFESPSIVRQLDWVNLVWPKHLKKAPRKVMHYPVVQKYLLMSVKGCYMDFHIDLGGSSVWHHVMKGKKVFWLIPPNERNLKLYERWKISGKQKEEFFGDKVDVCQRIQLSEGETFFIPSGFIHAVYTLEDSIVFSGNFLHSYSMHMQCRIAVLEETITPEKHRYPYFPIILWYTVEAYVYILLGKSYLKEDNRVKQEKSTYTHITEKELEGLKTIMKYMSRFPPDGIPNPNLITDVLAMVRDVRRLVEIHDKDSKKESITGVSVLTLARHIAKRKHNKETKTTTPRAEFSSNSSKQRRTRCGKCEPCLAFDCGTCSFCLDKTKFGGPDKIRRPCVNRQCLQKRVKVPMIHKPVSRKIQSKKRNKCLPQM